MTKVERAKDERWKMHWKAFVKEMRWLQHGFKRGGGSMKVDIKIKGCFARAKACESK